MKRVEEVKAYKNATTDTPYVRGSDIGRIVRCNSNITSGVYDSLRSISNRSYMRDSDSDSHNKHKFNKRSKSNDD